MDLERFVSAQDGTYERALAELRAGAKTGHWMWWIFPQLPLGRSETARAYAISDLDEAEAYLAHPLLGPRLERAARAVLAWRGHPPEGVLGAVDALKLRSSMTLFAAVPGAPAVFAEVLGAFYDGPDPLTLERLGRAAPDDGSGAGPVTGRRRRS